MTNAEPTRYEFEGFVLDPTRRLLARGDHALELRPKSLDVLCLLAERAGNLVARAEFFDVVWPGLVVTDESLSRCISDIRLALGDRDQRMIKTVPGRGYLLAVPVARVASTRAPAAVEGSRRLDPASLDRPSIAVLPFANIGADPTQAFLSDGITEDLIAALSRLRGFFVIARNTMYAYQGRSIDVRVLGEELGVRYVLEGSVRRAGSRLRVTAQLLEARSGVHLWAERYDRQIDDLFAIQDEITASIVGRIGTELLAAEYARISRKPPHGLDAWECVVRALFHSSQQSDSESKRALELLDQALGREPDYAKALGLKAWILVFRAFQGWENMPWVLEQTKSLIANAMSVDNDELWPYLAQGMTAFATRDNDLAVTALERAVALSPSSVNAHGLLGIAHAFGGRADQALDCIGRAMRLSPRDTYLSDFELYNAFAYFQAARYELGLKFAQQAHRLRPGHPYPLVLAAACAGHLGHVALGGSYIALLLDIVPIALPAWVEATSPFVLAEDRVRLIAGLAGSGLR